MPLPSEWVHRTTDLKWSTNIHGDESCQATLDVTADEAVDIIANNSVDPVEIYSPLGEVLYQGRLDDPSLALGEEGAFSFASMGGWAALSDLEESYTALWSTADYGWWREATPDDPGQSAAVGSSGGRYTLNFDGRIYITPQKGDSYTITEQGRAIWFVPSNGRRGVTGMQFDATWNLPTGWRVELYRYTAAGVYTATVWTGNGSGAVATQSIYTTFASTDLIVFAIYWNGGGTTTYAPETGSGGVTIENLRLVTSTANAISTTLTAARTNATPATLTVASSARMYAGQRLAFAGGGATTSALITAVNSSTSVTVDTITNAPVGGYPIGTGVYASVVYGDEVADDIAAFVNSVNSDQLAASGSVTAMSLDLVDCVYEDATPADVLNDLCTKSGDGAVWETGVDSGVLYLRPRGQRAQAWLIDVDAITLTVSLADLVNSAYAIYKNASGETVRSAATTTTTSVAEHGITRRRSVSVNASSAAQAQEAVDALLDDKATLGARATIPNITALYDLYGTRWPLWEANAGRGDTVTIRNVAPEVASGLEARLTFRLSRTTYDAKADTLTVELEAPRPGL